MTENKAKIWRKPVGVELNDTSKTPQVTDSSFSTISPNATLYAERVRVYKGRSGTLRDLLFEFPSSRNAFGFKRPVPWNISKASTKNSPQEIIAWIRAAADRATGYNYIAQESEGGLIKIGYSQSPENRVAQLQYELMPYYGLEHVSCRLIAVFRGSRASERYLLNAFAARQEYGEWFRLSRPLRLFIGAIRAEWKAAQPEEFAQFSNRPAFLTRRLRNAIVPPRSARPAWVIQVPA